MTRDLQTSGEDIRRIIQRHVDALSREIAREITLKQLLPVLEQWGMSPEDAAAVVHSIDTTAPAVLPPVVATTHAAPATLLYDPETRKWVCPRCRIVADTRRRAVTTHLRFCDAVPVPTPTQLAASARKRKPPTKKKKK